MSENLSQNKPRCAWVGVGNPLYEDYHDNEWGVPVHDDRIHFEFILLEGAQAGLSWSTILNKRKHYRVAFAGFDPHVVASFGENEKQTLLQNPGIVRNRLKIDAAVTNARAFLEVAATYGTFDTYIWRYVDGAPKINLPADQPPAKSKESEAISKDLKKRRFKFVGPTIIYAYMQAVGLVNDHARYCYLSARTNKSNA